MERIVANLIGNVRRESVDGRTYLVAPVAMIVPGVLNGSKGALMYPQDEVQKNPGVWNNVPITIGHPYGKNNEAISARDPQTLEKFQIGAVYNDRFEGGKRVADGWFDEALTKKKAPEVYAALNAGTPMEVSTGLFTDDEPAQNGAHYGGAQYQFIAKNYRPDHLAVLPNQRGACSIQDGCGLNTNGFCPTGEGGGQDNSCGREGGSGGDKDRFDVGATAKTDREHKQAEKYHLQQAKLAREDSNKKLAHMHSKAADAHHDATRDGDESFKRDARKASKDIEDYLKRNAAPNQPKSMNTGKYKAMNAGTGKGETHQSAQDGWHGGPKKIDPECTCPEGGECTCDVKANTFCPTGEGGGQDNSCGKDGGGGSGGTSHKDRLELARANGDGYVVRTKTGYREETKHGTTEYDKDGKITTFAPKKTSHEKRFAPKRNQRGQKMNRTESVQWLTTNCECHKGKEKVLANADNYSDAEIAALVENEQRNQTNQLVVNKFVEAVPDLPKVKINEIPAFIAKMRGDEEEEVPAEEEEVAPEEKPVGNKKLTPDQYLAQMPDSLRPVWDDMVANANDRRNELLAEVDKIVKNEKDPARKAIVENKLKGRMTNGELKELIALIRPTANASRVAPSPVPAPHYWGSNPAASPTPTDNSSFAPDLLLDVPSIDWAEMASPALNKRK